MDFICDPSLVLYLPLYQLDGASFMSKDAHGHLCSVTGALWRPNGRWFDGSDDKLSLGNDLVLYPAQFTWEFWVNPDDLTLYMPLRGGVGVVKPQECHINSGTGSIYFNFRQSDSTQITITISDYTVSPGDFTHLAFTADGSTLRGYYNALLSSVTDTYDGTILTDGRDALLIGSTRGSRWMKGYIGEVRLYSRALTPPEIQHNYLATKWRYR